jgi:pimeloyl-ACP methyl ester carboxylesterase
MLIVIAIVLLMLNIAYPAMGKQSTELPMIATVKDQYVIADGLKLHYVIDGVGQPVVLLHGNDGTLEDFTMSIFSDLAAKYQTIAFDRPGHGSSETLRNKLLTPQTQARILHSALNKLGIVHPLLVAHSWGGAVALSYALQFPDDISGLVLLSSVAYETKLLAAKPVYYLVRVPVVDTVMACIFMITCKREIERELDNAFSPDKAPKNYVHKFLSSLFRLSQVKAAARDELTLNPALKQMSSHYSEIHVPVIIVAGDCDKTVPPQKQSYPLHEAITQSKLIVLHNAGHELQFTRPHDVISAIDLSLQPVVKSSMSSQIQP